MARVLTLGQAAKVFIWFVVASILLLIGPRCAESVMFGKPDVSATARWMGVAITALSLVPWLAYVGWALSAADEYHRRVVLIGTAVAFALMVLYCTTIQVMADAHLIGAALPPGIGPAATIWVLGVASSVVYHRIRT